MARSVTQKRRQEIQCGHLWRRPENLGKLIVNTLKTMVENLKWKSESGEREMKSDIDIVFSDYRGRGKMLSSWWAIEILRVKIVF